MLIYFLYGVHFSVGYKNLESEPTFNQDPENESIQPVSNENQQESNVNFDDNENMNRTTLDSAKTIKSYYTAKVDRVQIDVERMAKTF